jgi:tetratricopeptide (TPR) repeat protein
VTDEDRESVTELHKWAQTLGQSGHHQEALALAEQVLALGAQCFAKDGPSYANLLLTVANEHYELRQLDEAKREATQAAEILRSSPAAKQRELAVALSVLGRIHRALGDYQTAEQLLRQSVEIHRAVSGERSRDFGGSLNSLGLFYRDNRKYEEAERAFLQVLDIAEGFDPPENPHVAVALENLGLLYKSMGRDTESELVRARARAIRASWGMRR